MRLPSGLLIYAGRIRPSRGNGFPFHPTGCIGSGRHVLCAPATHADYSAIAARPVADSDFPVIHPDFHLFLYRSNVGNGFPAFFLQNTLGHSEVMTGLLLTPWPLATLVTAPLAGYLVERIHPGILGSIGMVLFAIGLFSLSSLTAESSDISIILRLMLCGAGFGLFQTPNNSTIISSAPTQRSGGASGMLGMARLLGQTTGTTLVALLFSFVTHSRSTAVCLMVGSGFAVVAAIVSSLRLSQPSTLKRK